MSKKEKLFRKMLLCQKNFKFSDFILIIEIFGFFYQRTNGSHQIYHNEFIRENIHIQNSEGDAKPYQIRQFLKILEQYKLDYKE